jgi:transposase InsO family protein
MPTSAGLWIPWLPLSFLQRWPFAWWIGVVLDHASRAVVAERVFDKEPTAEKICALLELARGRAGRSPRYVISDRGCQFQDAYRNWCRRWGVRPRFGAVGKHGSIAIVERVILSIKTEALQRILVTLSLPLMCAEVTAYARWYNTCRQQASLRGATPLEVLEGVVPASKRARLEPRRRYPFPRGDPATPLRGRVAGPLELVVKRVDGRAHLPIVELRQAA